jgi:dGTPase
VPEQIRLGCGERNSERINAFISDLIANSGGGELRMSPKMQQTFDFFHRFMYSDVYTNPIAKSEENKVQGILEQLYRYYVQKPERLPEELQRVAEREGKERAAVDYISGMTDGYAMEKFGEIYIPFAWTVK